MTWPFVLVLAGRDPSGGAGVDADREAARTLEVDAACFVTAETDQDASGVRSVTPVAPGEWVGTAREVFLGREGRGRAIKLGLLPSVECVVACAGLVRELVKASGAPVVLDPVLVSSSGYEFLDAACRRAVLEELLPLGPVVTPNLLEAAGMFGGEPGELAVAGSRAGLVARVDLAQRWLEHGASAVLLKGGHGGEDPVQDLLLEPGSRPAWSRHERFKGGIRGSGCRFATAVAARLARGGTLEEALREAGELVAERIAAGGR